MFKSTPTPSVKTALLLGLVASAGSLLADPGTTTAPATLKMGPHTARELHSTAGNVPPAITKAQEGKPPVAMAAAATKVPVATATPVPVAKTGPVALPASAAKVMTDVRGPTFAYQAKPGDTLSGLAVAFGTTAAAIQALNPSVKEYAVPVVPGRTLTLPLPRTVKVPANTTLSHICARYGLDVNAVAAANSLPNPDHVVKGWVLQLWTSSTLAQR